MLIHLPIVILASLHPIAGANAVPQFDIARECRDEGDTKEMQQRCTDDEAQARKQLQAEWMQFSPRRHNPVQRGNQHRQYPQLC
ncbi:hypothetical protein FFI89_031645 [Bradyrhizobium sp. KBS0727]|uniref:hypothetical protein n=1 Tax=unclassified Bradyrhizobium TaxID=2631580 RepID=UPI00110E86CD|nr:MULTISPECIES: hypothetical protein [unclassified Bradyrhizobium]QDW41276.1 hypothetical protein FFI71_031650 [Bradyrhizobium sp. KBS0725]QDW47882.1 hypothetical protein FFI89_031645 [Bradyrhizobium sp. KBS0727]